MKWMIASDIHGSAYYAGLLVERFKQESADRLLLLGDLLYHGPRNDLPREYAPKEVIALLNPLKERLVCVRGNCDTEVDQMVLEFPLLADYAMLDAGKCLVYATHGHHANPQSLPPLCHKDVFLYGHTHIPQNETIGGVRVLNPGSVSIPKENSPHSYMMFENGTFTWKNLCDPSLPYDCFAL